MPKPSGTNDIGKDSVFLTDYFDDDPLESTSPTPVDETFKVDTPSGASMVVLNEDELAFYQDKVDRYLRDFKFKEISDLLELDRVLGYELMLFRYNTWLLQGGIDYYGNPTQKDILKESNALSKEVREIKAALGVDLKTRQLMKGGNTANFVGKLLIRGREMGIHRNEQVIAAFTLLKELQGLITLHDNCIEEERLEFNCRPEDLMQWCREKFEEFDEIDEKFRNNHQRNWIRDELN